MLIDRYDRRVDYLRLSVTDRCNLRCLYCLPETFSRFLPSERILDDEEILWLVSCLAEMGFSRVRVTGGEPLVRPGLTELIARLSRVSGVSEVSLSTNGVLLGPLAQDLARAGLKRVNISLDTLNPETFSRVTRFGRHGDVLEGIEAALRAGLTPVKLNVVVARGLNESEIADFARLTQNRPLHVRFIELMPMGETGFYREERRVNLSEMMRAAEPLEALPGNQLPLGHGPARYYRRPGAAGTIGFISALSCGFCDSCNRMRLSASGVLHPCLDDERGIDLRAALRQGAGRGKLKALILEALGAKPASHHMSERSKAAAAEGKSAAPRFMCQIGG